ncbi:hypothetical protein FSP39_009312 [Pinctada imbricata]|uniref:Dynactin subunit 4 n=1 Tax=Pinctada imbricata TaxID=66713 RepID=A0AA89C0Z6_PINIB|nr:hypothetical protein FSP39_009312 [Pinctada imbricata]
MSTFLNVELVKYLCSCGKKRPICKLYLCRYCLKVRCGDCVLHEVDTPFCPNCLEHMPSAEAKLKKNGCSSCFDCPSCGHILSNRATSMSVPDPENPGKTTPKRMFYMVCGFCRWSTRDSGIPDKSVASGGLEDPENPHAKTIFSLLGSYQQISKREKAEKDKKKYVRRRSYWNYSANMDKYGLISVAAKRKGFGNTTSTSVKEEEELAVTPITASEPVKMFDPLPEDIFTEALQLDKDTGIYPFNNKAVKALQPAPKAKNSEVSLPSDDVCTECGHSKENSLVKLGLVSKELANILVEPPVPQKKERSKKRTHEFAEAVPSKSQEKKQTKKQKKTETAHETEVHEEAEIADQSMDALCEVCMSSGLSWYFWVGCDTCTRWFHYECLPSSVQTDVDISLVVPEKMFICNVCKAEE